MFYSISDRPDFWKERLNLFTALAPVTRLEYTKNDALKYLHGLASNWLMNAMYTINIYELFGDDFSQTTLHLVCGIAPGICQFAEGFIITQNPDLDDTPRFQIYMGHFPTSASLQSLIHFAQLAGGNSMTKFDWGSAAAN
jgi:hypothetical protein